MFDHVTLRVEDLSLAASRLKRALDELEIAQTRSSETWAIWGNLALNQHDREHPITKGVHVAFIAPSEAHVDRFWQAGLDAGLASDGQAGPRPAYAEDYYAAFLKDDIDNSFEAVYREGKRPRGNVDHVAIRVVDAKASAAFYSTIGAAARLTKRWQTDERAAFSVDSSDGTLMLIAGNPSQNVHLAFSGDDDAVRQFHAEATAAGYPSNGEPGERTQYHDGYYAAYIVDPDGNNIEVVNHHR